MKKFVVVLCAAVLLTAGVSAQTKTSIKLGDNLPDRTSGMGLVFDTINAEFKAANPGVDFAVESYPDQPWQEKVKIYVAAKQLPDINKYWSFPGMFKPLIDAKLVQTLDKPAFDKLGFLPGSLEANVFGGKLYGLPLTADAWVIYYNKKLFADAGVTVPTTIEDLLALVPKFKAKGIIPAVTDGKDAWPLVITLDNIQQRISGDFSKPTGVLSGKGHFTDPSFLQAATLLQKMVTSGLFADDLMVSDYGASRNLFGQGKAAMYFMGTWELGLATDANFSQEFRDNVDAFKFPVLKAGGKGKTDDLMAWYGGNIFVNATGKNAALGVKYMDFLAKRWPSLAWEKQAGFPAQKVTARASDTPLAKTLLGILAAAKSTSGAPSTDISTAQFKDDIQKATGELCASIITPAEFVKKVEAAAAKVIKG